MDGIHTFSYFYVVAASSNVNTCSPHVQARLKLLDARKNMKDRMKISEGIKMVNLV